MTNDCLPTPAPPDWEELTDERDGCRMFQRGRHHDGTFIRVYVPKQAEDPSQPLRAILYLHGFALCVPSFYDEHMRQLAGQGWIVLYPDFQRSTYKEEPLSSAAQPRGAARSAPSVRTPTAWGRTTFKLLRRRREELLRLEDLPDELTGLQRGTLRPVNVNLPELRVRDLRRVLLPWLLIRLVFTVIGWFRRNYARNLGELIGTVLLSLAYAPKDWLHNAVTLAESAWNDLARDPRYAHWASSPVAVYGFGHSLGGLLTLSLPSLESTTSASRFAPRVIVASDPATSTEMGIPGFVINLLKLFNAPFTAKPLRIQDTGPHIDKPVAILHGLDDTIVRPQLWADQGGGGAFASVGGPSKALYFASSNPKCDLVAFHNQPVTSTEIYDDDFFKSFGGVKHGPNAYNTEWIWPALCALFNEDVAPPDLLEQLGCKPPFAVSTEPPPPLRQLTPWLLALAVIAMAVGVVVWRIQVGG
jgi:hypothetical protein